MKRIAKKIFKNLERKFLILVNKIGRHAITAYVNTFVWYGPR